MYNNIIKNIEEIDFTEIMLEVNLQVAVYEKAKKEGTLKPVPKDFIYLGF